MNKEKIYETQKILDKMIYEHGIDGCFKYLSYRRNEFKDNPYLNGNNFTCSVCGEKIWYIDVIKNHIVSNNNLHFDDFLSNNVCCDNCLSAYNKLDSKTKPWSIEERQEALNNVLLEEWEREHGIERCGHCLFFKQNKCYKDPPQIIQESKQEGHVSGHVDGATFLGFGSVTGRMSGSTNTTFEYKQKRGVNVDAYDMICVHYKDKRKEIPKKPKLVDLFDGGRK